MHRSLSARQGVFRLQPGVYEKGLIMKTLKRPKFSVSVVPDKTKNHHLYWRYMQDHQVKNFSVLLTRRTNSHKSLLCQINIEIIHSKQSWKPKNARQMNIWTRKLGGGKNMKHQTPNTILHPVSKPMDSD